MKSMLHGVIISSAQVRNFFFKNDFVYFLDEVITAAMRFNQAGA